VPSLKNNLLNTVKAIAAYSVVFIHCRFPSDLGAAADCLARFAVPLFFMTSGYYCYNNNTDIVQKKLPRKIRHIAMLILLSNAGYFIWKLLSAMIHNKSRGFLSSICNQKTVIKLVFFNVSPFSVHLWFLFALLYCYLLFAAINKYQLYKIAYTAIPILLGIQICLGELSDLTGHTFPTCYVRNFLLLGMPFFMLGNFIHKNENHILAKFNNLSGIICIVSGAVLALFERKINGSNELFIGSIISVTILFVYIMYNKNPYHDTLLMNIGETCSLGIYILHPIIIKLINKIPDIIGLQTTMKFYYMRPILICILATAASYILYIFQSKVKSIKSI
jgi:surface polysaccharide O-acyltransferase-like enzyme